jgi:hypothetical protein
MPHMRGKLKGAGCGLVIGGLMVFGRGGHPGWSLLALFLAFVGAVLLICTRNRKDQHRNGISSEKQGTP